MKNKINVNLSSSHVINLFDNFKQNISVYKNNNISYFVKDVSGIATISLNFIRPNNLKNNLRWAMRIVTNILWSLKSKPNVVVVKSSLVDTRVTIETKIKNKIKNKTTVFTRLASFNQFEPICFKVVNSSLICNCWKTTKLKDLSNLNSDYMELTLNEMMQIKV